MTDIDHAKKYFELFSEADNALTTLVDFFYDNARHLTCQEADTIVEFYTFIGLATFGQQILEAHSRSDEEGDAHVNLSSV